MIVISEASPIIAFSTMGYLEVFRFLYKQIVLPEIVCQEITVAGKDQPGIYEVWAADWIDIRSVNNHLLVRALETDLDSGEAEAIATALDSKGHLLLVNERRARAVAKRMGIDIIGIMGVLVEAKKCGLIRTLKPVLDELILGVGFGIRRELYEHMLHFAGEK